jgi:hypothetical protein
MRIKVYELMLELSKQPAGAEVRIRMLKTLDEIPAYADDDSMREIDFPVEEVQQATDKLVNIDGY